MLSSPVDVVSYEPDHASVVPTFAAVSGGTTIKVTLSMNLSAEMQSAVRKWPTAGVADPQIECSFDVNGKQHSAVVLNHTDFDSDPWKRAVIAFIRVPKLSFGTFFGLITLSINGTLGGRKTCLLYTSPSPRD